MYIIVYNITHGVLTRNCISETPRNDGRTHVVCMHSFGGVSARAHLQARANAGRGENERHHCSLTDRGTYMFQIRVEVGKLSLVCGLQRVRIATPYDVIIYSCESAHRDARVAATVLGQLRRGVFKRRSNPPQHRKKRRVANGDHVLPCSRWQRAYAEHVGRQRVFGIERQ